MIIRQEIEALRILSALGIVWFHSAARPSLLKDVVYSSLVIFLIISMFLATRPCPLPKPLAKRAMKLMVPWAIWSVFYGTINVLFGKPFLLTDNGVLAGFLIGSSLHLWYLPFIFVSVLVFDRITGILAGPRLAYICAIAAAVLFVCTEYWRPLSMSLGYPWAQYGHAAGGILIGVVFANARGIPGPRLIGLIALILAAIAAGAMPFGSLAISYLIGVLVAALVLLPQWEFHPAFSINSLSDCTFGIYLSHIFWLKVVRRFGITSDVGVPLLVFAISAITIWSLRKAAPSVARYTT